jgi:sirohydrochlorin cobaltochelatase
MGAMWDDRQRLASAALVLIGHGSTQNAESSAPVRRHAAALRERGRFAEVLEAFWQQPPYLRDLWDRVTAPEVFVMPLFISEGYFTLDILPRALGLRAEGQPDFARVQRRGDRVVRYCEPIGSHPSMTEALLARAREIVARFPGAAAPAPDQTALLIAGHGTRRNDRSRQAIERQVALIRARGAYAEVHAVFMEEEPRIDQSYQIVRVPHLIVVPFFVGDGLHVQEDIPVMLGEEEQAVQARLRAGEPVWPNPTLRHGKRVWYTSSVGLAPQIADVILERVREAAGRASP